MAAAWWSELFGGTGSAFESSAESATPSSGKAAGQQEGRIETAAPSVVVHNHCLTVRLEVWQEDRARPRTSIVLYDVTRRGSFYDAGK